MSRMGERGKKSRLKVFDVAGDMVAHFQLLSIFLGFIANPLKKLAKWF